VSKTEGIARAFLCFRMRLSEGKDSVDMFGAYAVSGFSLIGDFAVWVRAIDRSMDVFKDVPADEELMTPFREAEVDHSRNCEANAQLQRRIVADEELGDRDDGDRVNFGYGRGPAFRKQTKRRKFLRTSCCLYSCDSPLPSEMKKRLGRPILERDGL